MADYPKETLMARIEENLDVLPSEFNEAWMSASWRHRQSKIALPLRNGRGGLTRKELIDLKCPSMWSIPTLRRVMEYLRVDTLEEIALRYTLEDFLEAPGASEGAANVFCHLLLRTTKLKPWDWVLGDCQIARLKQKILRKRKPGRRKKTRQ